MANKLSNITFQLKRGTKEAWHTNNPVLAAGEIGLETDTKYMKIGDGITAWNNLDYNIKDVTARADITNIKQDLSSALHYIGKTTTPLFDGATNKTVVINNENVTAKSGDVVIYGANGHNEDAPKEFVFSGFIWNEFGSTGSLKSLAFSDYAFTDYTPEGAVAAPTITRSVPGTTTTIKNPTKKTVVTDVTSLQAGSIAPANDLDYYTIENGVLSLNHIGFSTGDSITTNNVTVKTGDATYTASAPSFIGTETTITVDTQGGTSQPPFTPINNDPPEQTIHDLEQYVTYGISIDTTNENPETAITYINDAIGKTPGVSWMNEPIFEDIKPILLKNGEITELNPADFSLTKSGAAADITTGSAGDVMIRFPYMGYKISNSGNTITIQITNEPNQTGFCYKAFLDTYGYMDIGAYLGYVQNSELRSLSGKSPTNYITNAGVEALWENDTRTGLYGQIGFYQITLLQCLFLIMYKNRDSQTALGRGYIDDNSSIHVTGGTNAKGMNFGENTGKQQMKFLGIEDFWGNLFYWIPNAKINKPNQQSTKLYLNNMYPTIKNDNFTPIDSVISAGTSESEFTGYLKNIEGNNDSGFIPKLTSGGSTSKYYCDEYILKAGKILSFGSDWSDGSKGGAFRFVATSDPENSYWVNVGARLMHLEPSAPNPIDEWTVEF